MLIFVIRIDWAAHGRDVWPTSAGSSCMHRAGSPRTRRGHPDIDALHSQQANELDTGKRAAILEKMQRLVYEKAIFAPIWLLAFLNGVGPRVGESSFGRRRRLPLYRAVREHNDQGRVAPSTCQPRPGNRLRRPSQTHPVHRVGRRCGSLVSTAPTRHPIARGLADRQP